jgi:hypothetical protein
VALSFTRIALAVGIVVKALDDLTDVIKKMGQMSWTEIVKGLTVMAISIGLIGAALYLLPKTAIFSAAAIFIVAKALTTIAAAMGTMGGMSWEEIAKSLIMLAGSLTIITAALYLMTGGLAGAAAVIVIAAALRLLAPVLLAFGGMSWGEIVKGLIMLAGVFVVLGLAGLVLTPVVPTLLALGLAIALLGVGMMAAGAGMLLFSMGLAAVALSGTAAAGALVGALRIIMGALPGLALQFAAGIIAFAGAIAKAAPAIVNAMVAIMISIMNAIDKVSPRIIQTLGKLLLLLLAAAIAYIPKMTDAGMKILTGILNGIAKNVGKMVTAATNVAVNFLKGISQNLPRIQQAGVDLIIKFVNGTADAIRNNSKAMGEAGGNLATAIIEGMVVGLAGGVGKVADKAISLAKGAINAAKNALASNSPSKKFIELGKFSAQGMAIGLDKYSVLVSTSSENLGKKAIDSLRQSISGISDVITTDAEFNPVIRPVLDLTDVKTNASQIGSILSSNPIAVTTSYAKAKAVSSGYQDNLVTQQDTVQPKAPGDISFTQINNSPKPLSNATIYRQTKNQLSVAKGALTR